MFTQVILSLQVVAIIGLIAFTSCPLITGGCDHIFFSVFASCSLITAGCHHRFHSFWKLSPYHRWLHSQACLFWKLYCHCTWLFFFYISTIFASCSLITRGCHHRFHSYWKLSCHYWRLHSQACLFL